MLHVCTLFRVRRRPVRVLTPLAPHPAQGAAQAVTSTVKAPETYSKSALLEIYAQKTEAPWVKRASSRKYSVRRHSRSELHHSCHRSLRRPHPRW